jgi:hypothetical protein
MSGRISRLRFRYRPSRAGRMAAYTIVLVGFVVWLITGVHDRTVPSWTLLAATAAYFVVAFAEKFTFEDDTPSGD